MYRILISATFPSWQLLRQTPAASGRWEEFQFLFEPSTGGVDGWVVYDNLPQRIWQCCPRENTLLITGEPRSVRRYRSRFTGQFAHLWTSQSELTHPQLVRSNEAQPWHYAMRDSHVHGSALHFDQLEALERPAKPKLMSVICSGKTTTADQRQRLKFTRMLQAELGETIDVFGRDSRPVNDKADAIWPYKYHVVLENDHQPLFMTEKLPDAFLGWSYPIYFGGPEASDRFPTGSLSRIDIYRPEQALTIIREVIASHRYEESLEQTAAARRRVLHTHNLMALLARFWRERLVQSECEAVSLVPKSHRAELVWRQGRRLFSRRHHTATGSLRRAG